MCNAGYQRNQWLATAVVAILCGLPQVLALGRVAVAAEWTTISCSSTRPLVQVHCLGKFDSRAKQTFLITHGLGGTVSGDRFHVLAEAVSKCFPHTNVLLADWSASASAKLYGDIPNPWKAAQSIDPVAQETTRVIANIGIRPQRLTMIGESFGNCVNARIAARMGGVAQILACNPANELGGYPTPDLRQLAKQTWSFHSNSAFDSPREIADVSVFIETPTAATDGEQHIAGIQWLTTHAVVECKWLTTSEPLPARRADHFQAVATPDGRLAARELPRRRADSEEEFAPSLVQQQGSVGRVANQ